MSKFIIKVFIFLIPLCLLLIPPVAILKISGENYTSLDTIIVNQQDYLIGYAYNEQNYRYLKWYEIHNRNSIDILALGTSRILQFRKDMFPDAIFYNAGYTVGRLRDYKSFLESIGLDKHPKILLINIDHWMFNANWDNMRFNTTETAKWKSNFQSGPSLQTILNVWSDLISQKYTYNTILEDQGSSNIKLVGLNSIVNRKGFRKDGSMSYGDQITKLLASDSTAFDYNFNDTAHRIKTGTRRFEFGSNINPNALFVLDDFLEYCQSNDIYVIAILPPFSNSVNVMLKDSPNHSYMGDLPKKLSGLFLKFGFEFWDYTDLNIVGSNDSETLDGFHGSEVAYLRILIDMINRESKVGEFSDIDHLKFKLSSRKNSYEAFTY